MRNRYIGVGIVLCALLGACSKPGVGHPLHVPAETTTWEVVCHHGAYGTNTMACNDEPWRIDGGFSCYSPEWKVTSGADCVATKGK